MSGPEPRKVNWELLKELCNIQCTLEEVCTVMRISAATLDKKIKESHGITFKEYFMLHQDRGRTSLRRLQWKSAEKGNVSMQQFLGKQYLGQSDKQDFTHEEKTSKHERLLKYVKAQEIEDNNTIVIDEPQQGESE